MKIFAILPLCVSFALAILPNENLSSGKPAHLASGQNSYLTDGSLTNWKSVSAKDIAIPVGKGASKLFVSWELYANGEVGWGNYTSNCAHTTTTLSDFSILTSGNSTTGLDGDWDTAYVITGNEVLSRGVNIDFAEKSWIRFSSEKEMKSFLEIEVFDVTNGSEDTWFFMGTSISQMGLKQQESDTTKTTAALIHEKFPDHTPAMLRGGIGCINSDEVVAHLPQYLENVGNVHFWAIEMGTNDAWGGGDWNLQNYIQNMQIIIDSAKAHGITPIIARIIATDSAKATWQVNPLYLNALDSLVEVNKLPKGPDFFSYFKEHPELLASDGVHPNAETGGGSAMHRLWADALTPLYEETSSLHRPQKGKQAKSIAKVLVRDGAFEVQMQGKRFDLSGRKIQPAN